MAESTSTPTNLTNLLESLSVNDSGSAAEQALSNTLAINVPLDVGVEGVAGFFATKLGLRSDNSLVQTAAYVLTKTAILETVEEAWPILTSWGSSWPGWGSRSRRSTRSWT